MGNAEKLIEEFDGRFRSGNSVPVDRIWLTPEMWRRIRAALASPAGEDGERLDALEAYVHANGGLVLHDHDARGNYAGLGLAGTRRTLRQAIDSMRGAARTREGGEGEGNE